MPHTSVVIDWGGRRLEYYFGSCICVKPVGEAVPMEACEVLDFGTTTKTEAELIDYLRTASPRFTVTTYDVFSHNCNNFSDELARFLTGQAVPERILNMANEALSTPRGQALRGLLEGFDSSVNGALNQHRHKLLKRCSNGLMFLRQRPEPMAPEDSIKDVAPPWNPPARTPDRTRSAEEAASGNAVGAADFTAADPPRRHRLPTPYMTPNTTAPDAAPHTAALDADLGADFDADLGANFGADADPDGLISPAARLRRGVHVSVIPDENKLAAFHAAASHATPVAPALGPQAEAAAARAGDGPTALAAASPAELMMDTLVEQERRRQEWIAYHLEVGEEAEARALGWDSDGSEEDEDIAAFFVGMVDSALMADAATADLVKALQVEQASSSAGIGEQMASVRDSSRSSSLRPAMDAATTEMQVADSPGTLWISDEEYKI